MKGAQKNEKPVAGGGPDGSCGRTQRMRAQDHCSESAGGRAGRGAGARTRTFDNRRAGARPGRSTRPRRRTWCARTLAVRRHFDIALYRGAGWQPGVGCTLIT
jgi:hypothetical protein